MKEQKKKKKNDAVELDLFTPEALAAHAMAAAAEEAAAAEVEAPLTEDGDDAAPKTAPAPETASASAAADNTPADDGGAASAPAGEEARKKKRKKRRRPAEEPEEKKPKTFMEQIHDFINEDEDQPLRINIKGMLGGEGLPAFFRKNWVFISVIVFFTCCYVTCRYMMQTAVLEHDKLVERLIDVRYKALTLDSELLERTLSSHIEKSLKDSTIHTPTEQSYPLPTGD